VRVQPVSHHFIGAVCRTCRLNFTLALRTPLPQDRKAAPGRRSGASRPRGLLALQRNAGNQAVGAILARFKGEEQTGKRRVTLELDGIGAIDVESVQARGTTRFTVTIRGHAVTAALNAAARNGTIFENGRLTLGNMRIELKGVLIAGLELNGDLVTLELDATSAETKYGPDEEEKEDAPRKRWDDDIPPIG
jgi:hypothetical protein